MQCTVICGALYIHKWFNKLDIWYTIIQCPPKISSLMFNNLANVDRFSKFFHHVIHKKNPQIST